MTKAEKKFHQALMLKVNAGVTARQIAEKLGTSIPTVERWINKRNFPHPFMMGAAIKDINQLEVGNP